VNDLALWLFGPLAGPECRRSLARGRVVLFRAAAGVLFGGIAIGILWWWWTGQQVDPGFRPYRSLRNGLTACLATEITLAMILTPALLAGSLAGEKERESTALLMTTRVSPREIVMGRALAKFSLVGMILLTGLPTMILLAELAGIRPPVLLVMLIQPAAVAFGIGGVALAASAMSRRGRDALLVVYLLLMAALGVVPLVHLVSWSTAIGVIDWLSPYAGMLELAWAEETANSLGVIGLWTALGAVGLALASWRLRPSWLRAVGGEGRGRFGKRNLWVPPLGDRPILWKELHIERAGSLGRVGKWLGAIVVAYLVLGSTILAGNIAWYAFAAGEPLIADQYRVLLGQWITDGAWFVSALIQAAVAARAAVAISSERERGTWDGLLTSPLEGKEIIRGKLWGSLHALRVLFLAALWAWTVALACGAMKPAEFAGLLISTILISSCVAAIGIRISLSAATATKAMTFTILAWLATVLGNAILASLVAGVIGIAAMFAWDQAYAYGLVATSGGPRAMMAAFGMSWWPCFLAPFAVTALLVLSDCRLRFDRLAGRMTGGEVAAKLDEMLHGRPRQPVLLGKPHHSEESISREQA
jgi:ABC-type transport system involved in multi-copper enzyme maturation permease subunit